MVQSGGQWSRHYTDSGASGHVFLQPLDTGQLDRNHNAGIVQSSIILGIIHCGDDTDPSKHHHTALCTNHPLSIWAQTLYCLDTELPWPVAPTHLSLPGSQQPPPGLPGPRALLRWTNLRTVADTETYRVEQKKSSSICLEVKKMVERYKRAQEATAKSNSTFRSS